MEMFRNRNDGAVSQTIEEQGTSLWIVKLHENLFAMKAVRRDRRLASQLAHRKQQNEFSRIHCTVVWQSLQISSSLSR